MGEKFFPRFIWCARGNDWLQACRNRRVRSQPDARQRVDLKLEISAVSDAITVTGAAGLLEADNSSRGEVINPREIVELPLNGRAYADLTLLVPGVAKSPLENGTHSSRDGSFNANGQRSELNNFMLDGIDNNAYGTSNQGFCEPGEAAQSRRHSAVQGGNQ
jgi:hypothetical protein